jgi:hypothetical protein
MNGVKCIFVLLLLWFTYLHAVTTTEAIYGINFEYGNNIWVQEGGYPPLGQVVATKIFVKYNSSATTANIDSINYFHGSSILYFFESINWYTISL